MQGFFEEAVGYLPAMEQELRQMADLENPTGQLNELHRLAHSLRGACNMAGLTAVGGMAQNTEEFLDQVLAGEAPWDEESRQLILECVGQIQGAFAELPSDLSQPQPETKDILNFDDDGCGELPPELIDGFIEEAEGHLDNIGSRLRELEQQSDVKPAMLEIRRSVHTIKGAAGMVGFMSINKLTHRMEDLLDHLYEGSIEFNPGIHRLLLSTHDLVSDLVAARGQIGERRGTFEQLFHQFGAALKGQPLEESTAIKTERTEVMEVEKEAPAAVAETGDPSKYVRVPIDRLDGLVRLVGELFVSRSIFERHLASYVKEVDELGLSLERLKRLTSQLETEHAIFSPGVVSAVNYSTDKPEFDALEFDRYSKLHLLSRDLAETADDVASVGGQLRGLMNGFENYLGKQGRLTSEAQDKLMRLRMVPMSSVSNRLHRTVRVTAQKRAKEVELFLDGAATELDKTVLEQLAGPIEHLLRNAVDHGIESAEERLAVGKESCGQVRLRASYEGTQVVIRLTDDGRGFNLDKIRKAAVRLDIAGEKEVSLLSPKQLHELLFLQGFTTAEEVTDISGRGVGLDIVRASVEGLKGSVLAESHAGTGTTFTIRLPLTLAITKVLFVESHQQRFAIPISTVSQTARVPRNLIEFKDYQLMANLERGMLPAKNLSESLGLREMHSNQLESRQSVVVIKLGEQEHALLVDKIHEAREVMVKPLGGMLTRVHGVAGATILGDGEIVLILNPAEVVANRSEARINAVLNRAIAPKVQRKALEVLIVDDSLSVRRVIANLMKNTGWNPTLAKDGVDALEILSKMTRVPDVILTDVEMPRMDGFEFSSKIRGQIEHANIPIIMLTSRSGDKHRNKATSVGVSEYLVKPYLDEVLLATIKRCVAAAKQAMGYAEVA